MNCDTRGEGWSAIGLRRPGIRKGSKFVGNVLDVERRELIPVDLDADFGLTIYDEESDEIEWLLDEGTPRGRA